MSFKGRLDADLKTAMLSGDKDKATILRGLKSAILNEEIATNKRGEGLADDEVIKILQKESKKRQESADLYRQGGNEERARAELAEKAVIEAYLPTQLSDSELGSLVGLAIRETDAQGVKDMGRVIALVKQKSAGQADGGRIAAIVKSRLGQ